MIILKFVGACVMLITTAKIMTNLMPRPPGIIFLGHSYGQKRWKLYNLDNKKLFASRDVQGYEDNFPFDQGEDQ